MYGAGSRRCCPHTSFYLSLTDRLAQSGSSFDIYPSVAFSLLNRPGLDLSFAPLPFAWDFVSRGLSHGLTSMHGFLGSTRWLLTSKSYHQLGFFVAIFRFCTILWNAATHNHDQFRIPNLLHMLVCGLWEDTETWRACRLPTERLIARDQTYGHLWMQEETNVRIQQEIGPILPYNTLMSSCRFAYWQSRILPSICLESKEPTQNKHNFTCRPFPSCCRQLHRPHQSTVWNPQARPVVDFTAEK